MLNYKALEHSDDFGTEVICWVEVAGVPERFVDEAKRIDGENYSSDCFGVCIQYDRDKGFKCDVAGNDKRYGFHLYYGKSKKVVVFEAAIDLMSYITMFPKDKASMVALGMLADAPLETFLAEHPEMEEIWFCLDNDGPGRKAAASLQQKYTEKGYRTDVFLPPEPYKDFNQWNVEMRKAKEQEQTRENFQRYRKDIETGKRI